MIYGIGTDIIKVERIKDAADRWGERFLRKVFTEDEIAHCLRKKDPYPSLSVRFAAKEALIKAVGLRISAFTDIEILNDKHGKPVLKMLGRLEAYFNEHSLCASHVSLSHEREYGIAVVVIERSDK